MVYQKIKKIYITLTYITNLITFIVTQIYGNKTKRSYEYTSISKYVANFYIIILNIIFILNTLLPKFFIANFFSKHCYFIASDWGKMTISYMISIMFWGTDSLPHFLFGIITLVSCLGLYITEFIFNCQILNKNNISKSVEYKKIKTNKNERDLNSENIVLKHEYFDK